jgi:chromate transporter
MKKNDQVSLWYLFYTFLKIGSAAFGGFMSLIAVIQHQLAERDKVIKQEDVLDGITLTSILPGPMAVNTVAYIGYKLRGTKGALISMLAVIIPSFILICSLSYLYFEYGELTLVKSAFNGIVPAVCGVILSIGYKMGRKHITDYKQIIIAFASTAFLFFIGGFFTTFLIIIVGGIIGFVFYKGSIPKERSKGKIALKLVIYPLILIAICLLIIPVKQLIVDPHEGLIDLSFSLLGTFSSVSISLFGGGYVFLPVMQEIIVDHHQWVNTQEFADGIALGQVTPGPIMITATFVGYKVMGVGGAAIATVGMFLPPGLLTVFCARFFDILSGSSVVKAAFKGIRPAVIGMILSAALIIGKDLEPVWQSYLIGIATLGLSIFTKIHLIYLILAAGILGIWLF